MTRNSCSSSSLCNLRHPSTLFWISCATTNTPKILCTPHRDSRHLTLQRFTASQTTGKQASHKQTNSKPPPPKHPTQNNQTHTGPCFGCCKTGHTYKSDRCPTKNETCAFCKCVRHYTKECQKKTVSKHTSNTRVPDHSQVQESFHLTTYIRRQDQVFSHFDPLQTQRVLSHHVGFSQ